MGNVDRISNVLLTAITDPSGGIITSAMCVKEAVGALAEFYANKKKIEDFAEEATKRFSTWAEQSDLDKEAQDEAVQEAGSLFLKAAISPQQFARADFDPEKARDIAIGSQSVIKGTPQMLHMMYDELLRDPDLREDLRNASMQENLSRHTETKDALSNVQNDVKHLLESLPEAEALFKKPRKWRKKNGPSALLNSDYRVVPFWGRTGELEDLRQWCANEADFGIRLYTGKGGMGKTRLLMETVEQHKTQGWIAGFIDKDTDEATLQQAAKQLLKADRPVLLVVDYAETQPAMVTRLIQAFEECKVFRLVLLARSKGDWWDQLRRCGGVAGDILCGPSVEGPFEIEPLADSLDKREGIYQEACKAFAETLEKQEPSGTLHKPEHDMYQRVLYIHLAALAAVQGEPPKQTPEDLLKYIVDKERRFLDEKCTQTPTCHGNAGKSILQAAAMATLGGTMDKQQAQTMLARCPRLEGKDVDVIEDVAAILHETYPGTGYISGVQPDIVGEHLVATALEEDQSLLDAFFGQEDENEEYTENSPSSDWLSLLDEDKIPEQLCKLIATDFLSLQDDGGGDLLCGYNCCNSGISFFEHGLTVLTRQAQRENNQEEDKNKHLSYVFEKYLPKLYRQGMMVAVRQGNPVGKVMSEALKNLKNSETAKSIIVFSDNIDSDLGKFTPVRELFAEAYILVVDELRKRATDSHHDVILALYIYDFSIALSRCGHLEEALEAINETVNLCRNAQESYRDALNPLLALSLNSLANRLSGLGFQHRALEAIQESVNIWSELSTQQPEKFTPYRAMSLINLANRLGSLELLSDALETAQEAVHLHRVLCNQHSNKFRHNLALSLHSLSIRQNQHGNLKEALDAASEEIDIRKALYREQPFKYLPDLAGSTLNFAHRLYCLGYYQKALLETQSAVKYYRKLAQSQPGIFTKGLAQGLHDLANCLEALSQNDEALIVIQEAVQIRRTLASQGPSVFKADLVKSLDCYGLILRKMGDTLKALEITNEAYEIANGLSNENSELYKPLLSQCLCNLANRLIDINETSLSIKILKKVIFFYSELCAQRPSIYKPKLATCLCNLAILFGDMAEFTEAHSMAQQSIDVLNDNKYPLPEHYAPLVAKSIYIRAWLHLECGEFLAASTLLPKGIMALSSTFFCFPSPHYSLMKDLVDYSIDTCQALGQEPDMELLGPIIDVLEKLKNEDNNGG